MSLDVFDSDRDPDDVPELSFDPVDPLQGEEHREDVPPGPRTVDAATWAARAIVVATLGLVAVVGGLLLGLSLTDSTPATATPTVTTSSTTTTEPTEVVSQTPVARVNAPAVRISAAVPDAPVATTAARGATVAPTRAATATQAPTVAPSPSPTSTETPRGKGNSGKPKPTKPS